MTRQTPSADRTGDDRFLPELDEFIERVQPIAAKPRKAADLHALIARVIEASGRA